MSSSCEDHDRTADRAKTVTVGREAIERLGDGRGLWVTQREVSYMVHKVIHREGGEIGVIYERLPEPSIGAFFPSPLSSLAFLTDRWTAANVGGVGGGQLRAPHPQL